MHANGLTREHFYDHQESIHYRETLNAEEFVLMTPPRGPYDNSLFQNIWQNINRISCGNRKTQCAEYTFTYKYSLLSNCVFFLLIKRQELTGVVHINHKNSIMSTPLLIISCNFSSCPPLPVPSSDWYEAKWVQLVCDPSVGSLAPPWIPQTLLWFLSACSRGNHTSVRIAL